jgi:tripartite ATP-independent transporter DctM subunit
MLLTIMMILLFIFILLGMDIAYSIGVAALAFIAMSQFESRPINPVLFVQELTAGVDSFSLLAIPMFIFAGELMTKSSVVRRLITLALSLVGHKPGGLGNVCITSNLFLAGISGSAVADAAAVGSTMIPEMKKRGYTARYAAGVISASACMAPIIPPSIMFILLGSIANISVGALFLGGILPGLVMFLALLAMNSYLAKRHNLPREPKMNKYERWGAIRAGLLPLGAPGLVIATKVLGIATPTESAALVVLYTLFLGCIVYRDMSWSGFMSAAISAAMISAAIMMTVATSQIFGSLAILAGLGQTLTDVMLAVSTNPWVLLMLINVALLILGTVMEPLPLMLILSPILFPLLGPMGIDPIHLGLILVFNLVLGGVTPPVGLNLFVMARVARIPMMQVFWGGLPFYSILFAVLILLTYVPQLTLFLPNLLMK